MLSFFFATMVALSFSGYRGVEDTTITSFVASQILYNENNEFIGYRFNNSDDDYQCWDYSGNIDNVTQYQLITGVGNVTFQIICDYVGTSSSSSAVSLKFKVVGESVSTNLYLSDFRLSYFNGTLTYTYDDFPNVNFNGQSVYYEDDNSGDFSVDIPYGYSISSNIYLDFSILCYDSTLIQSEWYNQGYNNGYSAGNEIGLTNGYNSGYQEGYNLGYNQGSMQDETVATIFSGILQVAMVPVNFFLAIFNFEILGVNLSGFITALFTIVLTIIVIRTIFGGKGGNGDS